MRILPIACALALSVIPVAGQAALTVGAKAPDFRTEGALGGKTFDVQLSRLLKKGPVVLYFFPAAFTPGCTLEAREFAEATDEFRKAGATVLGMSGDSIDRLQEFSVKECRNKFAVAKAPATVVKGFDVGLAAKPNLSAAAAVRTNRTSYVIAPNGRIIFVHSAMDYRQHVSQTLAAVRKWKAAQRK